MTCAIRRALVSDVNVACEVVRRSIIELCGRDHHDDPDTLTRWLANKTPPNFERWITSEKHIAIAAEIDGALVGFGLLSLEGRIALLYVSPDARFRGVSKRLLAALESEAAVAGIRELKLESSLAALPFYSKLGYTASGPACKGFGVTTCYPMSRPIAVATESSSNGDQAPNKQLQRTGHA
jgi:GNAT superfamily N-acetyltransferase